MSKRYNERRARQISYVLMGTSEARKHAYELLVNTYRVQSLHDLSDDQLNELVADVQAWEKEGGAKSMSRPPMASDEVLP